ncbi:hypothetical protein APS56_09670 [Pseudalgibacter alginicilyticus]|uniref:Uncharacterized protein n=1 Tax=Pseudalgibacter alginicilyticus TaxID=1736674 RepID=A0A0P0DBB3_9FLAO|nr:hypothetical protein [Pseudalgibacter alginicilyticus]ALJ05375.1 hypothetical protein APS56_09670 [Pseudalgibacter alginicilyticus]
MKIRLTHLLGIGLFAIIISCKEKQQESASTEWIIDSQQDWQTNILEQTSLVIKDGKLEPTSKNANFKTIFKKFDKKKSIKSIKFSQSSEWLNWEPVENIGPSNLADAPVALQLGEGNYWMFGRYKKIKEQKNFQVKDTVLEGFDVTLKTTPFKNQFDAPGGLKPSLEGYHAWQSKDMVRWVHHGSVTEKKSAWVTTAEYVDGKLYLYYDFPNDQDPHLYIDDNLTDGIPGENMGMVFNDPAHGSDCAVIRDLDGNFHLIVEDWSPIDASTHAWDSPLSIHAMSADGKGNFKTLTPPVDERTKPTGKFAEYVHPHWYAEAPDRFPGKIAEVDVPQHRVKAGQTRAYGEYEIHEPEQNAYGDWASISIGGQYYLFADFDPAGGHGRESMSVAWFTSNDINKPFTFCGNIGQGHPDPDILFAEGKFHLITQMETDYISDGPWVETVEVRVGIDTTNDGNINQWSEWQVVKEQYNYIKGFAKQIERIPATVNLLELPEGYAFQFEVKISDSTENQSKPILDKLIVAFEK